MSIDKYADTSQKDMKEVQIRFFDEVNEAKKWLAACQTTTINI